MPWSSIVLGCSGKGLEMDFVSCIILSCSVYVEDRFLMPVFDFSCRPQVRNPLQASRLPFSLMKLVSMAVMCVLPRYPASVVSLRIQYINEILALGMYTQYSWGACHFFLRLPTSSVCFRHV